MRRTIQRRLRDVLAIQCLRPTHRNRHVCAEQLESRQCLSSVGWDGPGRGAAELTYYLGEAPEDLGQSEFEQAIQTALDAWSEVADVTFTETDFPHARNSLDIGFGAIDGRGDTLAQAYLPDDVNPARLAGDIVFDTAERWEVGNRLGHAAYDLTLVAVHEIGHALGLDHSQQGANVMAPSVSAGARFQGLAPHDVDDILRLYADRTDRMSDPIDEPAINVSLPPTQGQPDDPRESGSRRRSIGRLGNDSRQRHGFGRFSPAALVRLVDRQLSVGE